MKYHFLLTARETSGFRRHIFCLVVGFWLLWVFVALHGLSQVLGSGGYSLVMVCRLLIVVASLVEEQGL